MSDNIGYGIPGTTCKVKLLLTLKHLHHQTRTCNCKRDCATWLLSLTRIDCHCIGTWVCGSIPIRSINCNQDHRRRSHYHNIIAYNLQRCSSYWCTIGVGYIPNGWCWSCRPKLQCCTACWCECWISRTCNGEGCKTETMTGCHREIRLNGQTHGSLPFSQRVKSSLSLTELPSFQQCKTNQNNVSEPVMWKNQ